MEKRAGEFPPTPLASRSGTLPDRGGEGGQGYGSRHGNLISSPYTHVYDVFRFNRRARIARRTLTRSDFLSLDGEHASNDVRVRIFRTLGASVYRNESRYICASNNDRLSCDRIGNRGKLLTPLLKLLVAEICPRTADARL